MYLSKFLKIDQLPIAIFTLIFSLIWYSFIQLPITLNNYIESKSLIFIILGSMYILIFGGLLIIFLIKIYTKNNSLKKDCNWKLITYSFAMMLLYNTLFDCILPTTKNQNIIISLINNKTIVMGALLFIIIGPIIEELICRGLFINMLFERNTFWAPIITSGLFFGLLHASGNFIELLYYVFFGIILSFTYKKTGILSLTIAIHIINNLISYTSTFLM